MGSYDFGKDEICEWIREHFPDPETEILDVGACDGKWRELLPEYTMDAVEIWPPYAEALRGKGYREIYNEDAGTFAFEWYDLIIFGDVIEHMNVEDAQYTLAYAKDRCADLIVAVPWQFPQKEVDGNPWQEHIQDDLTPEIFAERYPGLELLVDVPEWRYAYFHKARGGERMT